MKRAEKEKLGLLLPYQWEIIDGVVICDTDSWRDKSFDEPIDYNEWIERQQGSVCMMSSLIKPKTKHEIREELIKSKGDWLVEAREWIKCYLSEYTWESNDLISVVLSVKSIEDLAREVAVSALFEHQKR